MQTKIYPSKLCGQYVPVQSKSMMHRALICGSFCTTESSIIKPLLSDDIRKTMQILQDLGINIKINNESLTITPLQSINQVSHPLDCGDSATTLRMLAPIIAYFAPGVKFLISNQLKRRIKNEDFAFLDLDFEINDNNITFGTLKPKKLYHIQKLHTTQTLSGLLLLLPLLNQTTSIIINNQMLDPYLELTLKMMKQFGAKYTVEISETITIKVEHSPYHACSSLTLPKDYSAASSFILGCALNNEITIIDQLSKPYLGDEKILDIVSAMGCQITNFGDSFKITSSHLLPIQYDFSYNPDIAPSVIAASTLLHGTSQFSGLTRLVDKESNRLEQTIAILKKLGADLSFDRQTLTVLGPTKYVGGQTIDACGDHRIVFMLTMLGSFCQKPIIINGSEAISKSYPTFFHDFALLGGKYEHI